MKFRSQTALQGVYSAMLINLAGRATSYVRHLFIAAYIGLSAELDAFYMALSILGVFVMIYGDIFDSLGVPGLVATLKEKGEKAFRERCGSILRLTLAFTAAAVALFLVLSPVTPELAPGFAPEKKSMVMVSLWLLAPMALAYLPYHSVGSFFRAIRRFQVFYIAEFFVSFVALVVVVLFREFRYVVPVAWSAGYAAAILALILAGRGAFDYRGRRDPAFEREFAGSAVRLLPLYYVFYLYIIVDRVFASYLPTGSVSALYYGLLLAMAVPSLLAVENIFITPLSEEEDRGRLMTQIVSGIALVSFPVAALSILFAAPAIRLIFERGMFTGESTAMTADAMVYYSVGVPVYFLWPVCYRVFQVLRRPKAIGWIALSGVLLNAGLNAFFAFGLQMGIRGIALATSLSTCYIAMAALVLLPRCGVEVRYRNVIPVAMIAAAGTVAAGAACLLLPLPPVTQIFGMLLRGGAFLLAYMAVVLWAPVRDVADIRAIVRENLPGFRPGK